MLSRNRVLFIVGATALLAVASCFTTFSIWDGGYPAGAFQISVRNANGEPIPNASFSIYKKGTVENAFDYPFGNYRQNRPLTSDAAGQMTAFQYDGGIQFGGTQWFLFWVIPIGRMQGPQFDCKIEAMGYEAKSFDFQLLLQSPHKRYEDFPKTLVTTDDGTQKELPIYQHEFVMQKSARAR